MVKSVAILSSAHDLSDVRTHRWTRALQSTGCEVTLYLKGDVSTAPIGAICADAGLRSGIGSRLWADLRLPWQAHEEVWIVLDPELPLSCLPVAWLRRRKLVTDVHEDYEQVARDRPWARGWKQPLVRLGCRFATQLAGHATVTAVADDHVPPVKARKRVVVPNRPSIEHLPRPSTHDEKPRAVYVGDVRASRGSMAMVRAVAAAPGWHLDLIGSITATHRAELEAAIPDEALQRIRYHGQQAPERTWELVQGAQVGLALLTDTPAYHDSLPTKVVEYHAAGLALIVSPLPRMVKVVEESQAGIATGSVAEAAAALTAWSEDRAALTALGESARTWAEHTFSGEDPFDRAAALIAAL
jgi:glycosyltransferase involved in cell wall biosynthesis